MSRFVSLKEKCCYKLHCILIYVFVVGFNICPTTVCVRVDAILELGSESNLKGS